MPTLIVAAVAGSAAGLIASGAMSLYQSAAAPLFGQDKPDDEPATVKAADSVSQAATGHPVPPPRRMKAGSLVHYATGLAIGVFYGLLVYGWPGAAIGFGIPFGIVLALVLDDVAVPVLGLGPWPWKSSLATHGYGLTAHIVFGAALEGSRRLLIGLLA